ncbi:exonuclease subunit SbcD [Sutterella sp.]|uniref:exonuclease subunit SbcD n=1 Tax=Sutterella sp. TaxID=1981025 RepID=UPI0026DED48D|nr:exonuclease subunit SbcD [Sutterella sp.]MDO5531567.1 exonuclease subunit SbcD [Sutterella sp.]
MPQYSRPIKVLHTSDWHLGRTLADVDRKEDFRSFLAWLLGLIHERKPDVLVIAGDVFDTTMPASEAQRLYYEFLTKAASAPVGWVVVTAGNHDSQRFLRAPRELLATIRTFVAGSSAEDEAFVLRDEAGAPLLGIAAVPYLREGDVRIASEGESDGERAAAWGRGVAEHYRAARTKLAELLGDAEVPVIATGHLFVTGSATGAAPGNADGSVHVGTIRNVASSVFGDSWDYVALGHIHRAQKVKAAIPVRYSGSPLALDIGGAEDPHQVVMVTIGTDGAVDEELIEVPQPRRLARVSGDILTLKMKIEEIASGSPGAIVEAVYEGEPVDASALVQELNQCCGHAGVYLAAVRSRVSSRREGDEPPVRSLDEITPDGVFKSVLDRENVEEEERARLAPLFAEILETALAQERERAAAGEENRVKDGED